MPVTKPIVRFLALALLCFVALATLGPTRLYPSLYRATANVLFQSCGSGRVAKFEPFDDPRGVSETRMSVGTRAGGFPHGLGLNTVREGYVPTALVVALGLATPLPWRRRLRLLVLDLVVVHVFLLLRLCVTIAWGFSVTRIGDEPLLALSPFWATAIRRLDQILTGDLNISYVAPVLIWAIVTMRHRDVREALGIGRAG